jgi:16S rRNA (adenine1518-N6/adenine1519-N6)-dimethyltransferase
LENKKFRYKKGLGQNFLHDTVKIDRMVSHINPLADQTFIEIGPGSGNLTIRLIEKVKKLFAVERDREAMEKLKERTAGRENLEIINGDFLETDIKRFYSGKKLRVIGNIPYYITAPIIEKLIENREFIENAYLTVQKEVAERIVAKEGSKTFGSLSLFVQYYAAASLVFKIGRKAFFPEPEVDSAFIEIDFTKPPQLNVKDEKVFFRLTRSGFNQRRKMLSNNIKREFGFEADEIKKLLEASGIPEKARAEDISIEKFAALSNLIQNPISKIQKR